MRRLAFAFAPLAVALLTSLSCSGTIERIARCEPRRPRAPEGTVTEQVVVGDGVACREAPNAAARSTRTLSKGTPVRTAWAAEGHYLVEGEACWVDAGSVAARQSTGTRGLPLLLTPILVAAGEAILDEAVEWLQGEAKKQVCGLVQVVREEGERVLVRAADGAEGWVARQQVSFLASVRPAETSGTLADLLEGGEPPPAEAGGLTVEVRVLRVDGTAVAADEILTLGTEYDLSVRCSAECFVRITAEQPEHDAVCQYHPSHLEGFGESKPLPAGTWVKDALLPAGMHFEVSEPVGEFDVIRVEASRSGPYRYVSGGDRGEGCQAGAGVHDGALTGCARGGGFSGAPSCSEAGSRGLRLQPQAAAVAEIRLRTGR
jgi:hypothetical protein